MFITFFISCLLRLPAFSPYSGFYWNSKVADVFLHYYYTSIPLDSAYYELSNVPCYLSPSLHFSPLTSLTNQSFSPLISLANPSFSISGSYSKVYYLNLQQAASINLYILQNLFIVKKYNFLHKIFHIIFFSSSISSLSLCKWYN